MFYQMDNKELCDKCLGIVETDLFAWWLDSMAKPEGNR